MIDYNERYKLIWGIKAADDLSNDEISLHTMNDIDLIYDKQDKDYSLSIETIYYIENIEDQKIYLKELYNQFLKFMEDNDYDINYKLRYNEIFHIEWDKFKSIEQAFATFKFIALSFINQE